MYIIKYWIFLAPVNVLLVWFKHQYIPATFTWYHIYFFNYSVYVLLINLPNIVPMWFYWFFPSHFNELESLFLRFFFFFQKINCRTWFILKEYLAHRSYYKNVSSLFPTSNTNIQSHFSANHLKTTAVMRQSFHFQFDNSHSITWTSAI